MKNNVTIHMGASINTVTVRASDGPPILFDRNKMDKKENSEFHREFMNAFRGSGWELNRRVKA